MTFHNLLKPSIDPHPIPPTMYMNFDSFAFECRISFELLAFIGITITMNLVAFVCTVRKLHEKIDRILDGHDATRIQAPRKPPAAKGRVATHVRAPPAQPEAPGGVRLHAILNQLPTHFITLITASNERLAQELTSIKALEDALTDIYATYPLGHADKVFEKLAEDVLRDFTPAVEELMELIVFRIMLKYDGLCVEHMKQRARKDDEDMRNMRAEHAKAWKMLEKFHGKLTKNHPQAQRPAAAVPGYTELFDIPNAWEI